MKKNVLKVCIGVACLAVVVLCFRFQSCSNIVGGAGDIPNGYGRVTIAQNERAITNQEIAGMELRYKFNGVDVPAKGYMDFAVGSSVEIVVDGYVNGVHRMHHVEPPVVVHKGVNVINISLSKSLDEVGSVYCLVIEEGGYFYTTDEALKQKIIAVATESGIELNMAGNLFAIGWGEYGSTKESFFAKLGAAGIRTNFSPVYTFAIMECNQYGIDFEVEERMDEDIKYFVDFVSSKLTSGGISSVVEEIFDYTLYIDGPVSRGGISTALNEIDREDYYIVWYDNKEINFYEGNAGDIRPKVDFIANKLAESDIATMLRERKYYKISFGDQDVQKEQLERALNMKNNNGGVISISGKNVMYYFEYGEYN